MNDTAQKELVRLLELDYERTTKLTEGVIQSGITFRGWSITLTLALIAVAFDRQLWQLGVVAVVLIVLLGLADAYHGWVYGEAMAHVQTTERILHLYYTSLSRGEDDPLALDEFEDALLAYKFGSFADMKRFRARDLLRAKPRFVFVVSYLTLFAVAVAATGFILILGREMPNLSCTPIPNMPGLFTCVSK